MAAVASSDIAKGVRSLGLAGRPVCLHSSLRSFGVVDGGADSVIVGFLETGCTLMVRSLSWRYAVLPVEGLNLVQAGRSSKADVVAVAAEE